MPTDFAHALHPRPQAGSLTVQIDDVESCVSNSHCPEPEVQQLRDRELDAIVELASADE